MGLLLLPGERPRREKEMTDRNAPGCGQIVAACALIIMGTLAGCTVGFITAFSVGEGHSGAAADSGFLWLLGIVGGLIVGVILAAQVLRRPGR